MHQLQGAHTATGQSVRQKPHFRHTHWYAAHIITDCRACQTCGQQRDQLLWHRAIFVVLDRVPQVGSQCSGICCVSAMIRHTRVRAFIAVVWTAARALPPSNTCNTSTPIHTCTVCPASFAIHSPGPYSNDSPRDQGSLRSSLLACRYAAYAPAPCASSSHSFGHVDGRKESITYSAA